MSNTLNTPIEAMEIEFPFRAREYSVRRGSGGAGVHRGGEGLVREIEVLESMTFALLTERRRHNPRGDGDWQELEPKASGRLEAGDRLRIETPGGGGWGNG
jgi:N-methylhydantoinase B